MKLHFLKKYMLSLLFFVSISNQVQAVQCFQYYNGKYAKAKWKEVSDPYWIGTMLANGRIRSRIGYLDIPFNKNKHGISNLVKVSQSVAAAFNQAFYQVRYFRSTSAFLEMMIFASSVIKFKSINSDSTLSSVRFNELVFANFNEVILPLLANENGELDYRTKSNLIDVLQKPSLRNSTDSLHLDQLPILFKNQAVDNLNSSNKIGLTILNSIASLWGVGPPVPSFSDTLYHHDLNGFMKAFELVGIKAKEISKLKNGRQFTLFLESRDDNFDSRFIREPMFILKVDGDVVVVAQHIESGNSWHFKVIHRSDVEEFNDPNVTSKKLISLK